MIARINGHPGPGAAAAGPPESPPVNPEHGALDHLSATRLKCWQECRLKFRFRYIERIPVPKPAKLFTGSVIHAVLQAWNLARLRGGDSGAEAMDAVFDSDWEERSRRERPLWEDAETEATARAEARAVVSAWLAAPSVPVDLRPEGVEVGVMLENPGDGLPPLIGVLDLVLPGGRVIDFKSTGRKPEPAMALHLHQTQLACYALLYRDATGTREASLELHHLVKGKKPATVVAAGGPADAAMLGKLRVAMRGYVEGITRGDWTANPGQHCAWCDYRSECSRWKGAG